MPEAKLGLSQGILNHANSWEEGPMKVECPAAWNSTYVFPMLRTGHLSILVRSRGQNEGHRTSGFREIERSEFMVLRVRPSDFFDAHDTYCDCRSAIVLASQIVNYAERTPAEPHSGRLACQKPRNQPLAALEELWPAL